MLNRDHAATLLQPAAGPLVEAVQEAWDRYLAEGIPRFNRTTRANIVNDHMHACVLEKLPNLERLTSPRADKTFYAINGLAVRLKYLKGIRSRNIETYAQQAIGSQASIPGFSFPSAVQQQMELDDIRLRRGAEPPFVSVGYVLDSSESQVVKVLAVFECRGRKGWAIDLIDLAAAGDVSRVFGVAPDETLPHLPGIAAARPSTDVGETPAPPKVVGEVESSSSDDERTDEGGATGSSAG